MGKEHGKNKSMLNAVKRVYTSFNFKNLISTSIPKFNTHGDYFYKLILLCEAKVMGCENKNPNFENNRYDLFGLYKLKLKVSGGAW